MIFQFADNESTEQNNQYEQTMFTDLEQQLISEDIDKYALLEEIESDVHPYDATELYSKNIYDISEHIDGYYNDMVNEMVDKTKDFSYLLNSNPDMNFSLLLEQLENIDENTFQMMLQSIDDL